MPNRTFTDIHGITRTISIDPLSLLRVKEAIGLDLLTLADGSQAAVLADNMPVLLNAISLLAFPADMPEAEAAAGMASDTVIPAAVDCLMLALLDYLPARGRRLLKKAWQKST